MSSIALILSAIAIIALSGLPALFAPKRSLLGQRVSAAIFILGSALGIGGTLWSTGEKFSPHLALPWSLPLGRFSVTVDGLSAFFLMIVFTVPALGALYSLDYWKQTEHEESGRRLGVFYGLLAGAMALVVISRDAVLFLIAWEVMALSAYFAATAEDDKPEVQKAGWIYLVATHTGTLALIALFAFWYRESGSFALNAAAALPAGTAGILFILAVIGFGFKAGIMPLHVWLPGAHANAPGHVSAVMSGVMLKMGVYGILRITGLLPAGEAWWAAVLLALGAISGVAGIANALGQRDMKRLLAYSSIENIGVIFMGMGLALLGRATGRFEWVLLGLCGALLHAMNHSLFKSLLFFGAGSVIHASHTRDIEKLGGLLARMPATGLLFIVGAVAICALPPLNGFAGEWLIYLGLFKTVRADSSTGIMFACLAAVALAMIGSLVVAAMVKLVSTVFLGSPRSDAPALAHEAPMGMRAPMIILALLCLAIGLFPMAVAGLLENAAEAWSALPDRGMTLGVLAPFSRISLAGFSLMAAALLVYVLFIARRRRALRAGVTWDCGYADGTARMQYTGRSFAQSLVDLFSMLLWPKSHHVRIQKYFPGKTQFMEQVPDALLSRIILPVFSAAGRYLPWVRVFQQGQTQVYVLYILIIALILFIL